MAEMARSLLDYAAPPVARANAPVNRAQPKSLLDYISEIDLLRMLEGTGIPERAAAANDLLNPLAAIPRAQDASQELFAPNRTGMERLSSTGNMLTELAGIAAPIAAAARAGVPAATALMEGLLGGSPTTQAVGDTARGFLADESGALKVWTGGTGDPLKAASDRGAWFSETPDLAQEYAGGIGRVLSAEIDPRNPISFRHAEQRRPIGDIISTALEGAGDNANLEAARPIVNRLTERYGTQPKSLFEYWNNDKDVSDLFRVLGYDAISAAEKSNMAAQTWGILDPSIIRGLPDPATQRGSQIIDMLTAGRAGEVTDEMLDLGDPVMNARLNEYLYRNYDLPMDAASRMQRAGEMGFDTGKTRYHGSELDLSYLDPNMGSGERYRTGVFSTDNPDVADSYVSRSGGTLYPIVTRRNDGGASIDASGANWNGIPPSAPARLSGSALEREFPELFSDVKSTAYDVAPSLYDDLFRTGASTNALARQRRFEGDSNITFQNLIDRGPAIKRYKGETEEMQRSRELSASQPSEVRVDFYGNQIRSPFARFDPRLAHLRNLSAGIIPLGLLSMPSNEEQY
jgi:hypothetical protein